MADSEQQSEQRQLDERVQKVLNVMAMHVGSFHLDGRTGELTFTVLFDEGELLDKGFIQNINEKVV
jgi:hypothetical protein